MTMQEKIALAIAVIAAISVITTIVRQRNAAASERVE